MKKKILASLAVGLMMTGTAVVANALTISYESTSTAGNKTSLHTGLDGFALETFNNATPGLIAGQLPGIPGLDQNWTWAGTGSIVQGSNSGTNAAPFALSQADASKYLSVPNPVSSGAVTATFNLGKDYDYFGIWWGSADAYNTLKFFNNGSQVLSLTGSTVTSPSAANGNWTAPTTNLYVNLTNFGKFDAFSLTSTQYAFEVDNIAVANVPEPAIMLMFGTGLIGLAGISARRKKK